MTRTAPLTIALALTAAMAACARPEPSGPVRVSGHVEATEVQVAAEVGGRLLELLVAEGDRVTAGDTIARLDTRNIQLQIDRARAERAAASAQFRFLERGARPEDVRHAQAQRDAAAAEADAIATEIKAAQIDFDRFDALLKANAGSRKQRDDALARVDLLRDRERSARERVRAAGEALTRLKAGATEEELDGARAKVAAADAHIDALEKARDDAVVLSPASGIVTQTIVDAGEMVAPHVPLLVVTNLDRAWANLFVPEPLIPRVKLGQAATVVTDAGDRLPGTVTYVSPQAEFTPRNVQTADERSRLVYRIKVAVDNKAGTLKSGMPVDAEMELP